MSSTEPQNRLWRALVRGPFELDNELQGRRIRSADSEKEGPMGLQAL